MGEVNVLFGIVFRDPARNAAAAWLRCSFLFEAIPHLRGT